MNIEMKLRDNYGGFVYSQEIIKEEEIEPFIEKSIKKLKSYFNSRNIESRIGLKIVQIEEQNLTPKAIWVRPSIYADLMANKHTGYNDVLKYRGLPVLVSSECEDENEDFIVGV